MILFRGSSTEDCIFPRAHRRFWKCQRSHLHWLGLPVIGLYSIPLITLSNSRLNPLLACSSWKVKNHFSDSLGTRIWFGFHHTHVGMFKHGIKCRQKPSVRHTFCWQGLRPRWQLLPRLPHMVGEFLIQQLPRTAVADFWILAQQPGTPAWQVSTISSRFAIFQLPAFVIMVYLLKAKAE